MAHLTMALLGPFEVAVDGNRVTWFQSNKARALLAYLAVEAAVPHARHALAGLLWPDVSDSRALHSLSQALCNLRQVLHDHNAVPPCLDVAPHTIQFNGAADYWLDVAEFARLVRRSGGGAGQRVHQTHNDSDASQQPDAHPVTRSPNLLALHQAAALYRGPFLDDLALGDASAFEEWVLIHRERLHRLLMDTLRRLAEGLEARGELEQALGYARRQVELEPWYEEGHVQVMRLLVRSGRRSEALHQYILCRRLLTIELGVEPGYVTTRLYEQIRDENSGFSGDADRKL